MDNARRSEGDNWAERVALVAAALMMLAVVLGVR